MCTESDLRNLSVGMREKVNLVNLKSPGTGINFASVSAGGSLYSSAIGTGKGGAEAHL